MMIELNILTKLNLKILNDAIDRFRMLQEKYDPIILMSPDTINELPRIPDDNDAFVNPCGFVARYNGYKVFSDPTMKYGEVQLR